MHSRSFCAKLAFLHRVCKDEDYLCNRVYSALAATDVESISLAKQCCLLELPFKTNFTDEVLNNSFGSLRSLKERILKVGHSYLLDQMKDHPSQKLVMEVAQKVGWMKIWDSARFLVQMVL